MYNHDYYIFFSLSVVGCCLVWRCFWSGFLVLVSFGFIHLVVLFGWFLQCCWSLGWSQMGLLGLLGCIVCGWRMCGCATRKRIWTGGRTCCILSFRVLLGVLSGCGWNVGSNGQMLCHIVCHIHIRAFRGLVLRDVIDPFVFWRPLFVLFPWSSQRNYLWWCSVRCAYGSGIWLLSWRSFCRTCIWVWTWPFSTSSCFGGWSWSDFLFFLWYFVLSQICGCICLRIYFWAFDLP